ncbi:MAG: YeeE/YedE family protein [Calditrichaeota bacterium]|nr:YeeE/YedE family protein [Calditrichota bacterium]MCB9367097.1 YeeE/YedE family protein [Calditrichota bacterium]
MGPFVPDPISNELNLVIALILGVAFGFVLEQAGFSSSRRLAGLFYGYDFTVLRVFFSAAVTAMGGIMLLSYFGLLDMGAIYINPLWLWPAIVGGAIMGVGFILGGYCPGTSICAASIGKIDALFFVGGIFLGVFTFAEMYSSWHAFYESSALGPIRVYDSLGLSAGWFAFVLIAVALIAFAVTSMIEKRVSPFAPSREFHIRRHVIVAAATVLAGAFLIALPNRKERVMTEVSTPKHLAHCETKYMTADELAFRLVDQEPNIQIIDVRGPEAFAQFALPGAVNIKIENLFGKEWNHLLGQRHVKKVLVADNQDNAIEAYHVLDEIGYRNLAVLEGGLLGFRQQILSDAPSDLAMNSTDEVVQEFRQEARGTIETMIKEQKDKPKVEAKKPKKVAGGC